MDVRFISVYVRNIFKMCQDRGYTPLCFLTEEYNEEKTHFSKDMYDKIFSLESNDPEVLDLLQKEGIKGPTTNISRYSMVLLNPKMKSKVYVVIIPPPPYKKKQNVINTLVMFAHSLKNTPNSKIITISGSITLDFTVEGVEIEYLRYHNFTFCPTESNCYSKHTLLSKEETLNVFNLYRCMPSNMPKILAEDAVCVWFGWEFSVGQLVKIDHIQKLGKSVVGEWVYYRLIIKLSAGSKEEAFEILKQEEAPLPPAKKVIQKR